VAVTQGTLTARRVIQELRQSGVTHVVWLVDTESRFMYDALTADPDLTLVPICREAEGMAIALGLMIGGKRPVVIIQNTGFLESGDSIRGLVLDLKLPLVMMIGYRGFHRGQPGPPLRGGAPDSAATYLEPTLEAWGVPHHLIETDDDVPKISQAFEEAAEREHAVAVLIGREYE
jgi:sulfopyruvate decarboxylase TPP-binding subunit